ncbi:MAG: tetratricopeptide repeat protein [Methyloligellaceae bacterium]
MLRGTAAAFIALFILSNPLQAAAAEQPRQADKPELKGFQDAAKAFATAKKLYRAGQYPALDEMESQVRLMEQSGPKASPKFFYFVLGRFLYRHGCYAKARSLFLKHHASNERLVARQPDVAATDYYRDTLRYLFLTTKLTGTYENAESLGEKLLQSLEAGKGVHAHMLPALHLGLAELHRENGAQAKAKAHLDAARQGYEKVWSAGGPSNRERRLATEASLLAAEGRPDAALKFQEKRLELLLQTAERSDPAVGGALRALAMSYGRAGDLQKKLTYLGRAYLYLDQPTPSTNISKVAIALEMARTLEKLGDTAAAANLRNKFHLCR